MSDWPHQIYGVDEVRRLWKAGANRICLTSPTGTGKTRMVEMIIGWGYSTLVLCHRSMLFEQWAKGFARADFDFGLQAAGYCPGFSENLQLGMLQTVSRRWESGQMELPEAEIVVIDEIHAFTGPTIQRLIQAYVDRGTLVVLVTATPVGIGHLAEELVTAAVVSDGQDCGALIPAKVFAPDEPDYRAFKSQSTPGVLQLKEGCKEVMLKTIVGRVLSHYKAFNPEQRPAILYAPGVEESKWFADQFMRAGIPWSHIDSNKIILNGEILESTRENRDRLLEASRTGETKGISNRFVLREGIDAPWLYHAILACTIGGLSAYIQMVGRLLRNHESMTHVIVQDHGGNFHRHGSPNADREWLLEDTDKSIAEKRINALREKKLPEPFACPKCTKVRESGAVCPSCGFAYRGKLRQVIQTDGTLRTQTTDIYRKREIVPPSPEAHKIWKQCVYACRNSGKTFAQARGLFAKQNYGGHPGADFPLMPLNPTDWAMKVADVPYDRLSGYTTHTPKPPVETLLFD